MSTLSNFSSVISNVCLPSLEDISLLSITMHVMELELEKVKEIFCKHFSSKWLSSCLPSDKVSKITSLFRSFPIPEVLEAKYISLVHWIIDQCNDWIYFVMKEVQLKTKFEKKEDYVDCIINAAKWNINGTINYQLSLHLVLKYATVMPWYCDVNDPLMFKIASEYCLEDDINFLWSVLSPTEKKNIFGKQNENIFILQMENYWFQLYWACTMTRDMKMFLKFVPTYMLRRYEHNREVLELEIDFMSDADNCGFILAVLEGSSAAIKYFSKKLTCTDKEFLVHLIKIYLRRVGYRCESSHEDTDVLYFLLNRINDDEISNRIFDEYFMVFLRLSINYWPCHEYLGNLVKMSSGGIDYILFYELMTTLLSDVQEEKTYTLLLVRSLWRNISNDVKKLFCLFISNIEREDLGMINLWEHMTVDILNMFLKDEEFKKVATPYENNGISELILAEKYDVVDQWVEKCLLSEEAIISFMGNFIITKSVGIFKNLQESSIICINQFIDWAFKYEEFVNNDEILRIKDAAVEIVCVNAFLSGIELDKWEHLQKLTDWILKSRDDYEDKLIALKKKTLDKFFGSDLSNSASCKQIHFVKSLNTFICHGVSNTDKLKVMMNEIGLHERGNNISYWLNEDWLCVNSFLKFLSIYDVDIWKIKENTFHRILSNYGDQRCFEKQNFYENVEKFLYWNSETDPNVKKKVWKIKKLIIEECASENISRCICKNWWLAFNNILNCLLKEANEDENYAKIVFDFKKRIIENFCGTFYIRLHKHYFSAFINWGKSDEVIKKEIWNTKKYFIEYFKQQFDTNANMTLDLDLIEDEEKTFLSLIFDDHKDEIDFGKILWDFKEFVIKKMPLVCEEGKMLFGKLFKHFNEFKAFLNWNGFSETGMKDLKKWILDNRGVPCCLYWIVNNKLSEMEYFLDWCGHGLDFKLSVVAKLAKNLNSTYCWESLKYFLDFNFNLNLEQDKINYFVLKDYVFESCGVDICCNWILKNKWDEIFIFLDWCFESLENKKLIQFKIRLIKKHGPNFCNDMIFDNNWEKLKKFLDWCFESYEENDEREELITKLKIKTLQCTEEEDEACYKNNLEIVLSFLKWGFKSKARLNKFKKDILQKSHPLHYLVTLQEYKSDKNFQLWFVSRK